MDCPVSQLTRPTMTTSSTAKSSAIPTRISRLPLPSTSSSAPALKKHASTSSIRSSPAPNGTVRSRTKPSLSTTSASNPTRKAVIETGFKKPRGVLPLRQGQSKPRQPSTSSIKISEGDRLGDLDAFRSASRASSRPVSRDKEPETTSNGEPNTPAARRSRPSLSERTIESLAQVPSTPANRRRSSFFSPGSPMTPSSRPVSSLATSRGPLASSFHGAIIRHPSPSKLASTLRSSTITSTTVKRPTTTTIPRTQPSTKAPMSKSVNKAPPQTLNVKRTPKLPLSGSKTVSGRIGTKRPSIAEAFTESTSTAKPSKTPNKAQQISAQIAPSKQAPSASKSSAALREQIRKAKAERRSLSAKQEPAKTDPDLDFDISKYDDPFNQQPKNIVIRRRVDAARSDGRLNIAAMELKEIPEEVLKMYDYEFNKDHNVAWGEVTNLTRFIAADNELEAIQDEVFPDFDPDGFAQNEDTKGPQFGATEVLDLHGNLLCELPTGLRRLQNLTVLNLSRNRLKNDSLDTIAQISSLRELRLADNALSGDLSSSIQQLINLEVLELQGNKLSTLPEEIGTLISLRILNLSNNLLTTLPMESLARTSLIELTASKNHLADTLFGPVTCSLSRLRTLDVSINRLKALYPPDIELSLPELRTLNIAFNNITNLPSLSSTPILTELLAEDNKISSLPADFTDSITLRVADFTGNDFSRLDERIALMDTLETFRIDANPLRERKFLSMKTAELKADLRRRLEEPGHVNV